MSRLTSVLRKSLAAGTAIGARYVNCMNWRTFSGRLVTCSFLMTCPACDVAVSSSGAWLSTVMVSFTVPNCRLKSTARTCRTSSGISTCFWALKPSFSTRTVYTPTARKGTRYSPVEFVVLLRVKPVASFDTVTFAPGSTALEGSRTTPVIVPVEFWAVTFAVEARRSEQTSKILIVGKIISKDCVIANDKRFTYNRSAMATLADLFDPGADTSIRKGDQLWSRVANHLRHEIFTGQKLPGERLVETRIATQIGVAQSSVREALHELEREGLVVRVPGVGARVTTLTPAQIEQIYALRAELEGFAVELVAKKGSSADLDALAACLTRCGEAIGNDVGYMSADLEFHLELWKRAGNEFLLETVSRIVVPLFAFETRVVVPRLSREDRLESLARHERVVELLPRG